MGILELGAAVGFEPARNGLEWAVDKVSDIFSREEAKVENEDNYSKPIEIAPEDQIPNDQLIPPDKRGNAPKDKETGAIIEIHQKDPNHNGPFVEMKRDDHRGHGKYKENHPKICSEINGSKPNE